MGGNCAMLTPVLLLLLANICWTDIQKRGVLVGEISDKMISLVQTYCPYSEICNKGPILDTSGNDCCTSCSCDPSCEMSGTCCNKQLVGRYTANTSECASTYAFGQLLYNNLYMMIATCDENHTDDDCGSEGSKRGPPVTSTATMLTYVNEKCARCNSQNGSVPWKVTVLCPTNVQTFAVIEAVASGICERMYTPPEEFKDFVETCYLNVIDQCNITGLWDSYDEDTDAACKLINAPYEDNYVFGKVLVFANPLCALCNYGMEKSLDLSCRSEGDAYGGLPVSSLNIILDWNEIQTAHEDSDNVVDPENECDPNYISLPPDQNCFLLICPDGMIRRGGGGGECSHIFDYESAFNIKVFLKLTPTSKQAMSEEHVLQINQSLCIRFLQRFTILEDIAKCYVFSRKEMGEVRSLGISILSTALKSNSFVDVLAEIELAMGLPWTVPVGPMEMEMIIDFFEMPLDCTLLPGKCIFPQYHIDHPYNVSALSQYESSSLYMYDLLVKYKTYYLYGGDSKFISPFNFCRQVLLTSSMFIDETYRIFLTYRKTYLYGYQYSIDKSGKETNVRVCLQDVIGERIDQKAVPSSSDGMTTRYIQMWVHVWISFVYLGFHFIVLF